jgi:hypothetical protein
MSQSLNIAAALALLASSMAAEYASASPALNANVGTRAKCEASLSID